MKTTKQAIGLALIKVLERFCGWVITRFCGGDGQQTSCIWTALLYLVVGCRSRYLEKAIGCPMETLS